MRLQSQCMVGARRPRRFAIALAPLVLGNFGVSLLNDIGIGALVALGLVLLTGVGGATSFGQAAFVGIAAYATAWLTTAQGLSPWLGLLFALAAHRHRRRWSIGAAHAAPGRALPAAVDDRVGAVDRAAVRQHRGLGRHTGLSNIPPLTLGAWSLADPRAIYYLIWALVGLGAACSAATCSSRARAARSAACAAARPCSPASAPTRSACA